MSSIGLAWKRRAVWLALGGAALFTSVCSSACSSPTKPKAPEVVIGTFTLINRESPYLIAAPHGEFDQFTAEIVYDFCERVRWDCLVAEGFRTEHTINVNRPTQGMRLGEARFTQGAALVYSKYVGRIRRLSPRVNFYAEIHGHEHQRLGDTIDIATVGVSKSQAEFIKATLASALADQKLSHLRPRIDVLESIHYNATHARRFGVLSFLSPAMHVELPRSARVEHRQALIRALSQALPIIAKEAFPFQEFLPPLPAHSRK